MGSTKGSDEGVGRRGATKGSDGGDEGIRRRGPTKGSDPGLQ